ncbi:hypothetical protein BC629DRAFT_1593235 [Irpex lacteus]|nr:hypothetical protein BC629DRAFT_1593235 [Irpex lacteus]
MPELPHDVLHIIFDLLVPEWPDTKTQVTYLDEELEIKEHLLPCAPVSRSLAWADAAHPLLLHTVAFQFSADSEVGGRSLADVERYIHALGPLTTLVKKLRLVTVPRFDENTCDLTLLQPNLTQCINLRILELVNISPGELHGTLDGYIPLNLERVLGSNIILGRLHTTSRELSRLRACFGDVDTLQLQVIYASVASTPKPDEPCVVPSNLRVQTLHLASLPVQPSAAAALCRSPAFTSTHLKSLFVSANALELPAMQALWTAAALHVEAVHLDCFHLRLPNDSCVDLRTADKRACDFARLPRLHRLTLVLTSNDPLNQFWPSIVGLFSCLTSSLANVFCMQIITIRIYEGYTFEETIRHEPPAIETMVKLVTLV